MKRGWKAVLAGLFVAAIALPALPASAVTGTWSQFPAGGADYRAAIRPPINADGSSNWSAKSKGGIPVQWAVEERTTAAKFKSTAGQPYSFVRFQPSGGLTFNDVTTLSTVYAFSEGNCGGGSLRWQVRTDSTHTLFVYYGDAPNFTDCTTNSQSGANLLAAPAVNDLRFDLTQYGGPFYGSYQQAKDTMGNLPITSLALIIDSYWFAGNQVLTVSDTTVNDSSYDFVEGSNSDWSTVCPTEDAFIHVAKTDGDATGPVNEGDLEPAYTTDDGTSYRTVDCKYQYVLSVPSIKRGATGVGTYRVSIDVPDGTEIGFVKFDLK
jgi:hypothetical protein